MNIKKVDDKPMVIHIKEKTKLHVKTAPETKIKAGNVLTVERTPKFAGAEREAKANNMDKRMSALKVKSATKDSKGKTDAEKRLSDKSGQSAQSSRGKSKSVKEDIKKSMQKENSKYAQFEKSKQDREKAIGKKNGSTVSTLASVGAKTSLDQIEGGSEIYESYMVARNLSRPVESATDAGRSLYRTQAAKVKEKRIKKVQAGKKISKKAAKDSAAKAAKETAKAAAKAAAKETAKTAAKAAAATAGTAAGTATTGVGGVLIGAAAGEAVGIAMDKKDVKNSTRNRMIQLFVAKLRQEENQDSIGKALKDIALMRFSMAAKYIIRYVGLFLLALFALVALVALPIIAVIAIIYNSSFAIFFPSISSGETTQDVLSAYVAEFNREVNDELTNYSGYDTSEKIYVDFEGVGELDNYCDILAVYMVKYGNGDTATDMTDKAKENLKSVFDDMCGYTITERTDVVRDAEGNIEVLTIKEINIDLKTYQSMILVYGFNQEEQEILAELMKPESLVLLGYTGDSGGHGSLLSPEEYQAIVDMIFDANAKRVMEFSLSKVGYPYSQQLRHSGTHFDCSSLAYYAWLNAGIDISCEGMTTASYEAKYCYENNLLVRDEEIQPGDLIFYSYEKGETFMNITHVAIYAGNDMLVEAANSRIGVVYRQVHSRNSIVFIGRPR
ncbi:MAG: NlpC/P60 family protein [Acetatifactor sp.]